MRASTGRTLSRCGLALGCVASFVLLFVPPQIHAPELKGGSVLLLDSPDEDKAMAAENEVIQREIDRRELVARGAIALLLVSFLLQFSGTFAVETEARRARTIETQHRAPPPPNSSVLCTAAALVVVSVLCRLRRRAGARDEEGRA